MTSAPCECEIKTAEIKASEPYHFTELSGEIVTHNNDLYFFHRIHGIVDVPEAPATLKEGQSGRFQICSALGFRGLEVFVNRQNGFVQRIIFHLNQGATVALGSTNLENLVRVSPLAPLGDNVATRVATEIVSRYQDCADKTEFLKSVEMFYTIANGDVVNESGSVVRSHRTRAQTRDQARESLARHTAARAARAREMVARRSVSPRRTAVPIASPSAKFRTHHADRYFEEGTTSRTVLGIAIIVGVVWLVVYLYRRYQASDTLARLNASRLSSGALRPSYVSATSNAAHLTGPVKIRGRRPHRRE